MLKKILKVIGALLLVAVAVVGYYVVRFMSTSEVRFDEKAWAMLGGGGNTLVLESDAGPLVIDTKFLYPAGTLQKAVAERSGKPVKMVINTHFHFDHTGGNTRFLGAEFMAAKSVPDRLRGDQPEVYGAGKAGERGVPTALVETSRNFDFGDEQVEVRYLGRGHTDGDVVVLLKKRSILHTGDLFVNGSYPLLDTKSGASAREWVGVLDQVIAMAPARIIPGHGPVATVAEVKTLRDYLAALWESTLGAVKAGKSVEQAIAAFDASRFGLKAIAPGMGADTNVRAAYDEAKAWVAAGH